MLVGYTGFVGSNLDSRHEFAWRINSTNSRDAWGRAPDLCVFAGLRAEKFLANRDPAADWERVRCAMEHITRIKPAWLILISTIDVYACPVGIDEDTAPDATAPYGLHRLRLEEWVREHTERHLIVRLPALFGQNLKKNFIYDLINIIPALLSGAKYQELSVRDPLIACAYTPAGNGFYRLVPPPEAERAMLRAAFERAGFSALDFTDSRAVFQFYNLACLWNHIETALNAGITILNLATGPLSAAEVFKRVRGTDFHNELSAPPPRYDFRTKHAALFGGADGYVCSRDAVLEDIAQFVEGKNENHR
jgi:hypothetical protein